MATPQAAQPRSSQVSPQLDPAASPGRLAALDVFRGLTIAGMILVNNPGSPASVFAPLRHAAWHGWTVTDLVFPFFLFIVGVSIVFSCEGRMGRGCGRSALFRHALWRSLALIAIGLVMNGLLFMPWAQVRIPGVLQRIGLVYLLATLVTVTTSRRWRIAVTAVLLLGYWAVLALVPAPGSVAGDLSPAGNVASYVDRALLGKHLWRPLWDPEGVLSTFPAIGTALLGTFAGEWLRARRPKGRGVGELLLAGAAATIAGLAWRVVFPINKNLWTSSFVVFTAGTAAMLLALCCWAIDMRGWRFLGRPFTVFGMNPLAVFVLSEMLGMGLTVVRVGGVTVHAALYVRVFAPLAAPALASLLWAVAYVAAWWVVAWIMYRNTIFIKL